MAGTVRPDEWLGDKWSHEAIMDMQARMAPEDITRIAGEWKDILGEIDSLFSSFLDDVTATIGEGWSGPGAQAALSTMRSYVGNSRVALRRAYTLSAGLDVLAMATRELQQKIASPSARTPVGKLGEVYRSGSSFAQEFGLWEEALNHVRTMYSGPAVQAGNAVAKLTGPRERLLFDSGADAERSTVVDRPENEHGEQAGRAEDFLSRWGLGQPEPNSQQPAPQGNIGIPLPTPLTMAGLPGSPFRQKGFESGSGVDELGEDDVYAGQNWMRDPLWHENPTRSAGFESETPTSRQPLSADRMPSVGAGPTVATAGGVGAGATTRSPGAMMPMMGMYPPPAGQRRGDENEHYSPPYLVNRDNTRELLGELPKGSAPVIGLWQGSSDGADDDIEPPPPRGFRSH
ncbi:hypothetical protein [Mycobacteroides sp. LB1]|uniref:hypothetical protein n=1 Tax=Mycobacteroides sp. LB1 TaxID=2750814 RepID=UPI0015DE3DF5|nr:hypothetical protein [Mycobacteroides sp. LB1]